MMPNIQIKTIHQVEIKVSFGNAETVKHFLWISKVTYHLPSKHDWRIHAVVDKHLKWSRDPGGHRQEAQIKIFQGHLEMR